jgi:vacuolar-type H+-ATPase subunit E/Vma4
MNSELLRVVEQEAQEEAGRILAEARAQSEAVVAQAGERAEALRRDFRQRSESEERAAEARARSAANLEAQALLLEAKSRALETLFAEAGRMMEKLPSDKRRRALKELMAEAAQGLSGRLRLEVSPRDEAVARELLKELKLEAEVAADPKIDGGVVARSQDGQSLVLNRISDRLKQAKPLLTADLAKTLWG